MKWALLYLALAGVWGCRSAGQNPVLSTSSSAPDTSPYAMWNNGPSPDSAYFPIGVWLQSPHRAQAYQAIGINTYVGLWQGPTSEQLETLKQNGMRVICDQNSTGLSYIDDPIIMGWMHGDEPDNAQRQADGSWGGPVPVEKLQADYQRMRSLDPSRPVWLNLGQGVANDEWVGRAAPVETYPDYVATSDIVSFDVYPVSGMRKEDGENYLWYVAKGVERLRAWAGPEGIVWNIIETTRINSERGPTPAQVETQVWMSLIHGSRGIVYFAHEWNPVFREARLLEDDAMRDAVAAINAQIRALAPVLNAPTLADWGSVTVGPGDGPLAVLAKRFAEDLYVFAVAMRPLEATARFTASGLSANWPIEVLGEDRALISNAGFFSDQFAPYQVHRYRIPSYFAPR